MANPEKPKGYEKDLADFALVIRDKYCGEPVGWGFKIVSYLGNERFDALRLHGEMYCIYPTWYLITKKLSREEAIQKYGDITDETFGPKGGWKSVTFGNMKFGNDYLRPVNK